MIPRLLAITPGDDRDLARWLPALVGVDAILFREHRDVSPLIAQARALGMLVYVHHKTPGTYDAARYTAAQSCHNLEELQAAANRPFALLSPVWRPTSKPGDTREPLGLERFVTLATGRPVLALGGVTPSRYALLQERGFGAAVLGGLFGASSPGEMAQRVNAYRAAQKMNSSSS